MATIKKEKNYLIFTNDKDLTYKFDINTGVFYSTKGNPLKSAPYGFATYLKHNHKTSNLVGYMYYLHYNKSYPYTQMEKVVDLLQVCDRLDSLNINICDNWGYCCASAEDLRFINDNFKKFIAHYNALNEDEKQAYDMCKQFRQQTEKAIWLSKKDVNLNGLSEKQIDYLYELRKQFNAKELNLMRYYIIHNVWDFFENKEWSWQSNMTRHFDSYFKWCKLLEVEPKKEDFFTLYCNAKKNYITAKAELDKKALAVQYARHENIWKLESEELCIYVPTCKEDFIHEADVQKNCVFSFDYMGKVVNGDTYVVFIRQKANVDKPYITCEISRSGEIRQYYRACNQNPTDKIDLDFLNLLKQALITEW